jgi:hypothetical protein
VSDLNQNILRLQQLASNSNFAKAREDLYRKVLKKCDLKREPLENRVKIVSSEFGSDTSFGPLTATFLELIQADLTAFGPIDLFLNVPGWSAITVYSRDRMTIRKKDGDESEMALGFLYPVPPVAMGAALSEMQQRWDQQFPILRSQWRQYVIEGAIAPATKEIWFRLSSKIGLLEEYPMWHF